MCEHEELLDSGEFVCIKCGIVLGQEYIHQENTFQHKDIKSKDTCLYSSICTTLDHLNLNVECYAKDINDLIDKYLSNFKCKNELKIGACIYYLLSSKGIICQLSRVSRLVCSNINDSKKLFKIIQAFPQQKILSNDTYKLAEFLLSYTDFHSIDKSRILQLVDSLVCKFCSYSPVTQIARISYWYFKVQIKQRKSLKTICNSFLISQNSVHLYLNHKCTKNWTVK